jgi:ABC-type uncharacterized transport system permease subunit
VPQSIALYSVLALACMLPSILIAARRRPARDGWFWSGAILAAAGPAAWALAQIPQDWNSSLSATLWVGIAASMVVFLVAAAVSDQIWRLALLLVPYLFICGLFAWAFASATPKSVAEPGVPWLAVHIVVAVLTLALLTLAAVSALASHIQARALKAKRRGSLSRRLPAAADSDRLSANLLIGAEIVLAIGVVTGMALEHAATGRLLVADHKVMMTIMAFVIIAFLLIVRRLLGIPGQAASRIVLLAYLLVILGYFGVKFVHQMPIY